MLVPFEEPGQPRGRRLGIRHREEGGAQRAAQHVLQDLPAAGARPRVARGEPAIDQGILRVRLEDVEDAEDALERPSLLVLEEVGQDVACRRDGAGARDRLPRDAVRQQRRRALQEALRRAAKRLGVDGQRRIVGAETAEAAQDLVAHTKVVLAQKGPYEHASGAGVRELADGPGDVEAEGAWRRGILERPLEALERRVSQGDQRRARMRTRVPVIE
jgi:hypothetical protein